MPGSLELCILLLLLVVVVFIIIPSDWKKLRLEVYKPRAGDFPVAKKKKKKKKETPGLPFLPESGLPVSIKSLTAFARVKGYFKVVTAASQMAI